MLKPFNLNIGFDGNYLSVDYCDGSDVEHTVIGSQDQLIEAVKAHVTTALSPEDD